MMSKVRQRKQKEKQERRFADGMPKTELASNSVGLSVFTRVLGITLAVITGISLLGYYRAPYSCLPAKRLTVEVQLSGPFSFKNKITPGLRVKGLASPESLVQDDRGNLYTSLHDGRIVRIKPSDDGRISAGDVVNVTSVFIKNIPRATERVDHGRPLGLRLQGDTLYVADPNYGIYSLNTHSGKVKTLVKVNDVNPSLGYTDDLDVSKDGKYIYFSDVTSLHSDKIMYGIYSGVCDGRVLRYSTENEEIRTVVDNLCVANGVQLSQDDKLLFVSETMQCAIRVIDLSTLKILKIVNVPIFPDNIRPTGKGTYWIAGGSLRTPWHSFLERNPVVRQIASGLLSEYYITKLMLQFREYGMVLEMNEKGDILQSLHDPILTEFGTIQPGPLNRSEFR
ncbi:adipocyte plasma membrane-associated protein-like isoform X2 [Clavelina lepadiformis]|uniref:adipocyte plasma membrane-associated protein-like isoform X2 n=1 Tax=Clavelina lepadiformis TaxID=159417 RepID=UPI0040430A4D